MKSARVALLLGAVMVGAMITGSGFRLVADGDLTTGDCVILEDGGTGEGTESGADGTGSTDEGTVVESTLEDGTGETGDTTDECDTGDGTTGEDTAGEETGDDTTGDDTGAEDGALEDGDDGEVEEVEASHGQIVSTVAHCAPRGKDERLATLEMRNHGAFVRAAAHGDTLSVAGADYDLSTMEGAEALCAMLDAMTAEEPVAEDDTEVTEESASSSGKDKAKLKPAKEKKERAKPVKARKPKKN